MWRWILPKVDLVLGAEDLDDDGAGRSGRAMAAAWPAVGRGGSPSLPPVLSCRGMRGGGEGRERRPWPAARSGRVVGGGADTEGERDGEFGVIRGFGRVGLGRVFPFVLFQSLFCDWSVAFTHGLMDPLKSISTVHVHLTVHRGHKNVSEFPRYVGVLVLETPLVPSSSPPHGSLWDPELIDWNE